MLNKMLNKIEFTQAEIDLQKWKDYFEQSYMLARELEDFIEMTNLTKIKNWYNLYENEEVSEENLREWTHQIDLIAHDAEIYKRSCGGRELEPYGDTYAEV